MKIRKNDTIKIITGKDRGKTGKITKVFENTGKVLVDGLNLFKKHIRPKKEGEKGQTVEISRPLASSNVMLICPNCGKPTRIGFIKEEKNKFRICRKCNSRI